MTNDYGAFFQSLHFHQNGSITRSLEHMNRGEGFDPLWQDNLPNYYYSLNFGERRIKFLHLPSPIVQKKIDRAEVIEEFKNFLFWNAKEGDSKCHLLVNLNNRHMWTGHARAHALENVQKSSLFKDSVIVISLPFEHAFSLQTQYDKEMEAKAFIKTVVDAIENNSEGYYFSNKVHEILTYETLNSMAHSLHELFFKGKKDLTQLDRVNFISLFNMMIVLKVIEESSTASVSFTSKDGIDSGSVMHAMFYLFMHLINREALSEMAQEHLNVMLYGPAMLVRERTVLPFAFERLIEVVKSVERVRGEVGVHEFIKMCHQVFQKNFSPSLLRAYPDISDVLRE